MKTRVEVVARAPRTQVKELQVPAVCFDCGKPTASGLKVVEVEMVTRRVMGGLGLRTGSVDHEDDPAPVVVGLAEVSCMHCNRLFWEAS